MDLSKVLAELRLELENLDAAIFSLESLQQEGRRRGRPPKTVSQMPKPSEGEEGPGANLVEKS